ncbi:ABC transporter ATP-binding protein [Nocardioides alcanivorans]|uniref:ABC transporter ATP-binding protein n=1 Tax=Nocardioides alcanivorans TaxID=2897352 RepID=UPI0028A19B98|nr:ABC transporter ATP-binding protein [Nocardioides alcanivorans]
MTIAATATATAASTVAQASAENRRLPTRTPGGQRQRVWIAFVFAQDAEILLLDVPTTFLDLAHAIDDLNLAAQYAQHLVVMSEGAVVAEGAPADVLTADLLAAVFGLTAHVVPHPIGDGILVVPEKR